MKEFYIYLVVGGRFPLNVRYLDIQCATWLCRFPSMFSVGSSPPLRSYYLETPCSDPLELMCHLHSAPAQCPPVMKPHTPPHTRTLRCCVRFRYIITTYFGVRYSSSNYN